VRISAAYLRMCWREIISYAANNDNSSGSGGMLSMVEANLLKRVRF
jgi:hypothetical protein